MGRRNRRGLNRIGMLAIAMMIALGAMGVVYSAWIDTVLIDITISTGTTSSVLSCGATSPDVDCDVSNKTLTITVNDAEEGESFYCNFELENNGDIPIQVQSITKSGVPTGFTVTLPNLTDPVIDPGPVNKLSDTIFIDVTGAYTPPDPPDGDDFDVAFTIVLWNE